MPLFLQSLICLTLSLAATCLVHEKRDTAPPGWAPVRRADGDVKLPLRIALTQPNLASLEDYLLDVSHPDSANYGKHWSAAKVAETFRPSPDAIKAVLDWLQDEGFEAHRVKLSKGGSWVHADVTVAEAESLLGTEYHVYQHGETGTEHIACEEKYHLPEHVAEHVDLVMPTLHFDVHTIGRRSIELSIGQPGVGIVNPKVMDASALVPTNGTSCDEQITPDCIRQLYNFDYTPVAVDKNSFAICTSASEFTHAGVRRMTGCY